MSITFSPTGEISCGNTNPDSGKVTFVNGVIDVVQRPNTAFLRFHNGAIFVGGLDVPGNPGPKGQVNQPDQFGGSEALAEHRPELLNRPRRGRPPKRAS